MNFQLYQGRLQILYIVSMQLKNALKIIVDPKRKKHPRKTLEYNQLFTEKFVF